MNESDSKIPLWRQLQAVAVVLAAIRQGASGTAALEAVQVSLRPGVQALVYQVLRSLGRAEALRRLLASRKPPAAVDALLCTALALIWDEAVAPYESFTLVNQAVEAAKHTASIRAQAGFVNGCLRRFLRERAELLARTEVDPVAHWNHPAWWIERLRQDHPGQWQAILQANNRQAPMTLRVNVRKTTIDSCLTRLRGAGIAAWRNGEFGVTLAAPLPVQAIPGFAEGHVSVQDAAAQQAAPLLLQGLAGTASLRVLDACAAPGGKTAHLLELADCEVSALEIDPVRAERIGQTLLRLGLQARVQVADAGLPAAWWDGQPFDAILLDAPCTASGIVRRHPDVRWLRRESDVGQLAAIQARLLATLWPLLKPGGRLLYCTCSVFKAEGDLQIQTFLAHNTQARLLPSPGHLLPHFTVGDGDVLDNQDSDHDGFYYALLEKRAA
ncbi:MAG: 16S rRNA (cytosine(967)-C(5))-methyltransferase [Curvibacter sp. PD_MW3]|nr:MAG: 16S rRNA (cytosine(967)-C(5))-methyltransferase [Curvibacter sp. PD_MW3]